MQNTEDDQHDGILEEPVRQPEQEKKDPKNVGGQNCEIIIDQVPVDITEDTVDLGKDRQGTMSAERYRNQVRTIIWRDKLNLNVGMDCVTLLDKMSKFFDEIHSFELDPTTGKTMPNSE